MPRGDRTGPEGRGPMTGRRAGYCAGFAVPGYMNPGYAGYGFRPGFMGRMGGGRGRGYRNMYYATGLPAWARGGFPAYSPAYGPGFAPGYAPGYMPGYTPSAEEEKLFLTQYYDLKLRTFIEAIARAHDTIRELCRIQNELREVAGKPKIALPPAPAPIGGEADVRRAVMAKLEQACFVKGKENRSKAMKAVREEAKLAFADRLTETDARPIRALFEDMEQEIMRASIAGKGLRTDGRTPTQIRPITCEIGMSEATGRDYVSIVYLVEKASR